MRELLTPEVAERFWSKVEKTSGCWIWRGYRNDRGYGHFHVRGKPKKAHRISWVLTYGDIPDGFDVCHSCDNPACVNPDHLFLGTRSDNMQDALRKGRFYRPCGELAPSAKLTRLQVRQIRMLYAGGGYRMKDLAQRFGVALSTIRAIIHYDSWSEYDADLRDRIEMRLRIPSQARKLTLEDVRRIRSLHRSGLKTREIAEMFGITKTHVLDIVNGECWANVS